MRNDIKIAINMASQALNNNDAAQCARLLASLPEPENVCADEARLWAMSRDLLGRAQFCLGDQNAGLAAFEAGVHFFRRHLACRTGCDIQGALFFTNLLQNLCFAYLELKQPLAALTVGQEAIELAEQYAPDSSTLADVLFRVSAIHYRGRNFEEAESMTRRALDIWRHCGNEKMAGECLNNMGRIYEEMGQIEEGISWHKKAVDLRRTLASASDLAFSLGNLGVALATAGKWHEARENLREAVELYRKNDLGDCADCKGFSANLEICAQALAE